MTLLSTGTFDVALTHMTSYLGNVILPVGGALTLCVGIYHMAHGRSSCERYITAALACLLAAPFVRLAESFSTTGSGTAQFNVALVSLVNWLGNVILPIYAFVQFARGALAFTNITSASEIQQNPIRHFIIGGASLAVAGTMRLLEAMVRAGKGGLH